LERLRYLEIKPTAMEKKKELELIIGMLSNSIPGIEEFITEERYLTLKGKVLYNALGVRTEMPESDLKWDSIENMRSDDTLPAVGAGLYVFSSYIRHSCDSNAGFCFDNMEKMTQVNLVAQKDISMDEEIFVSWIVTKDKALAERRKKLSEIWRFICQCDLCVKEEVEELEKEKEKEKNEKEEDEKEKEKEKYENVASSSGEEKEYATIGAVPSMVSSGTFEHVHAYEVANMSFNESKKQVETEAELAEPVPPPPLEGEDVEEVETIEYEVGPDGIELEVRRWKEIQKKDVTE